GCRKWTDAAQPTTTTAMASSVGATAAAMANRGAWARTRLSRKVCRVRAGLGGYGPPPGRAPPMYADYPEGYDGSVYSDQSYRSRRSCHLCGEIGHLQATCKTRFIAGRDPAPGSSSAAPQASYAQANM
ncbi:unnamed protein product, partial [Pylaiella littoralis]